METVWVVLVERDGELFDLRIYRELQSAQRAAQAYSEQDEDQYVMLTEEVVYV